MRCVGLVFVVFFFSSRRRHTRCLSDWSSDVCSSDLRLQLAGFQPTQQVIQVDIDPDEIGRNHGLTFGLVGDARLTLERLLERLRAAAPRPSRKAEREGLRAEMAALDTTEPNAPILKALRAGTPEDAIVI